MDSQARVGSVDAFRDFRAVYSKFGDAARNALLAAELEIRRMLDWLEKDQVGYWKNEIRRREEKVNEAHGALHRKRITATFGNVASDSEEILMLRRAQAKLAEAQEKLKLVKQWYITVEQEVQEYRGPVAQLNNLLDSSVPAALSSLDRMTDIIESYLAIATPGASVTGLSLTGSETTSANLSTGPTAKNAETSATEGVAPIARDAGAQAP
ncbi:MAG: hypothetical protein K8U03_10395 [Planctomycetia bacterium]|nr:hypothetical protein [Planctomycetia bacterium]